ncbi:ABC-F family ATP-binding cassette domain-containing protein, partial [uncultured Jatrophihabitans sp.]|uniref:ABC-F family ATP-binding cassette domain-containing protein n=1 Tax=uncultured Jatrophihabitans sp. TaxID=1610747 RepID=UPI0035C96F61
MANLVNLERVAKAYGTTTVLSDVSLGVGAGERIGVVGRNGGGKSTLLRLISGVETPDSGRVTRTGGTRLAFVDQRGDLPDATVREIVVGEQAEHEWAGDAAVRAILTGLGLAAVGLDASTSRLSGGERRRVALAAALVQRPELLVLDEPTNHLDIEGITWLAQFLTDGSARGRRPALLVVTHDRWFLDAVCQRMWEVGDATVRPFDGGYAAYVLARAERQRQADAAEARRQNLLRKELAWLRRGPPARTSKPQFRIAAAEALIADVPAPRSAVELRALSQRRLGRSVVDVEDVTLRVGERTLLDHVTWHVGPGDRIGVVGVNGSGKSHLLRLIAGEIAPDEGTVVIGSTVHAAHLTQDVRELPDHLRVIEAVTEVRSTATLDGAEQSASQLAERFGFANERQWTPVADLSGGERRRLQLLRLLLTQPNVLLLDEPTNDLDTDTLAELEDLLDGWAGTLVVVSHDRYLLERVCDTTVALLGDGSLAALPGGVADYLARRAAGGARLAARV